MNKEYLDNKNTKAVFNEVIVYAAKSVYTTVRNLFRYENENELSKEDKLELERVMREEKAFKARLASNASKKGLSGKYKNNVKDGKEIVFDENKKKPGSKLPEERVR